MVDQPDIAVEHFANLSADLRASVSTEKRRILAVRQMNICLWCPSRFGPRTLHLDAPYRASELVLLISHSSVLSLARRRRQPRLFLIVVQQIILLRRMIAAAIRQEIPAYQSIRHALSTAIASRSSFRH